VSQPIKTGHVSRLQSRSGRLATLVLASTLLILSSQKDFLIVASLFTMDGCDKLEPLRHRSSRFGVQVVNLRAAFAAPASRVACIAFIR
jgi:hypothetical protein